MTDPHVAALCDLLRQRSAAGLAKYGTDLARRDLTPLQWIQHMREELADAALYCGRLAEDIARQDHEIRRMRTECAAAKARAQSMVNCRPPSAWATAEAERARGPTTHGEPTIRPRSALTAAEIVAFQVLDQVDAHSGADVSRGDIARRIVAKLEDAGYVTRPEPTGLEYRGG